MKPKPLVALNHLTVPVAILTSPRCAYALTPARPSRELDPISAMSWGGEPVRRDQQGKSTIRMGGVYAALPQIASANRSRRQAQNAQNQTAAGSTQPADLFLGHHALDIFGLALDAVARASVRLDRQARNDGIDAALLDAGAALRPLQLVVNIVVNRVIVGHRLTFRWTRAFRRNRSPRQQIHGPYRARISPSAAVPKALFALSVNGRNGNDDRTDRESRRSHPSLSLSKLQICLGSVLFGLPPVASVTKRPTP